MVKLNGTERTLVLLVPIGLGVHREWGVAVVPDSLLEDLALDGPSEGVKVSLKDRFFLSFDASADRSPPCLEGLVWEEKQRGVRLRSRGGESRPDESVSDESTVTVSVAPSGILPRVGE